MGLWKLSPTFQKREKWSWRAAPGGGTKKKNGQPQCQNASSGIDLSSTTRAVRPRGRPRAGHEINKPTPDPEGRELWRNVLASLHARASSSARGRFTGETWILTQTNGLCSHRGCMHAGYSQPVRLYRVDKHRLSTCHKTFYYFGCCWCCCY